MTATKAPRGRPEIGPKIQVRLRPLDLDALDLEAELHGISRAELIRGILAEWVRQGYGWATASAADAAASLDQSA